MTEMINKSTISISRNNGTEDIFIDIVDRVNKKAVTIRLNAREYRK